MTMSVQAKRGSAQFHCGTATWCALSELSISVAPDICAACKRWFTNDGDGLDAKGASALAERLEAKIQDGTIGGMIREKIDAANALPDEPCDLCKASGVRTDERAQSLGFDVRKIDEPGHPRLGQIGWCNGCGGRGHRRPFEAYYPLTDASQVVELVSFLRTSGGFQIY